ncbi:hypothetical protein FF2_025823 [Malus domestica]
MAPYNSLTFNFAHLSLGAGAAVAEYYYYPPPLGDRPAPYGLLNSGNFWIQGLHMDRVVTHGMTGLVAGDRVRKLEDFDL